MIRPFLFFGVIILSTGLPKMILVRTEITARTQTNVSARVNIIFMDSPPEIVLFASVYHVKSPYWRIKNRRQKAALTSYNFRFSSSGKSKARVPPGLRILFGSRCPLIARSNSSSFLPNDSSYQGASIRPMP